MTSISDPTPAKDDLVERLKDLSTVSRFDGADRLQDHDRLLLREAASEITGLRGEVGRLGAALKDEVTTRLDAEHDRDTALSRIEALKRQLIELGVRP